MDKVATVHGRFQGLHWGHMEYLDAAKKRCEHLFIGITHPLIKLTNPAHNAYSVEETNPNRNLDSSNPFTYYQRYVMIKNSLLEYGFRQNEFDIIPFPIENPDLLLQFIPSPARHYITIYDAWGEKKYNMLRGLGLDVEILWTRRNSERFTSGTEVRRRIRANEDWVDLVPPAVFKFIQENDLQI